MSRSSDSDTILTSASGSHLTGYSSNSDVKTFSSYETRFTFFPRNLEQVFPNVDFVYIQNGNISKLTKYDLQSLGGQLKKFYFVTNELETVNEDLFEFNPNLEYLSLNGNKIHIVGLGAFDSLQKLTSFYFMFNRCHSDSATDRNTVIALITQIEADCPKSRVATVSRILKTEKPSTTKIFKTEQELKIEQLATQNEQMMQQHQVQMNQYRISQQLQFKQFNAQIKNLNSDIERLKSQIYNKNVESEFCNKKNAELIKNSLNCERFLTDAKNSKNDGEMIHSLNELVVKVEANLKVNTEKLTSKIDTLYLKLDSNNEKLLNEINASCSAKDNVDFRSSFNN